MNLRTPQRIVLTRPTPLEVKCEYCAWTANAPAETPLQSVRWLRELVIKHVEAAHPEQLTQVVQAS